MHPIADQIVRWHPVADADELRMAAYRWIIDASARAVAARGRFVIVLAGGNTPRGVYALLRDAETDWLRWDVWFGDERCASPEDPDRNSAMARHAWLDRIAIPQGNIHFIPAELGAVAAASAYAEALADRDAFDLVLLGLGEDGHTASLFPDHDWGTEMDSPDALAILDAGKPPPQRVSLSAERLGRSREVLFLVDGEAKRDAVGLWCARANIPAHAIRPPSGVDVLVEAKLLLPPA